MTPEIVTARELSSLAKCLGGSYPSFLGRAIEFPLMDALDKYNPLNPGGVMDLRVRGIRLEVEEVGSEIRIAAGYRRREIVTGLSLKNLLVVSEEVARLYRGSR